MEITAPPFKRSVATGHISALPDELLSQVLKLLPFSTKAAAHSVSKRWNSVLRHPVIPDLWNECELDLGGHALSLSRDKQLWQTVSWLARRAYGITLLVIVSTAWANKVYNLIFTEAGYFYKQQLPYLLGQLHFKGINLRLSFTTDLDLVLDPLLTDSVLQSYIRTNLIELALKQHLDSNALNRKSLECLWELTNLQTLDIRPLSANSNWQISPKLSQLTALRSFQFQRGILEGPLVLALGSLPSLIEFKTSCIPDAKFSLHLGQFTSLRSFTKSSSQGEFGGAGAPAPFLFKLPMLVPGVKLAKGQSLGLLRKLSLHDCILATAPPSLATLSCLKKIKFKNCRFTPEGWLNEALLGATQIERMTIVECTLQQLPSSLCQLTHLKNLTLASNDLTQLPEQFSQLTSLRFLGLYSNDWCSVPQVLEHMTHLQEISLAYSAQPLQITRPLTFLLDFPLLLAFNIAQAEGYCWDSVSMYHIGEYSAALDGDFYDTCWRRPEFLWH